jgi:hypothetical protein
MTDKSTPNDSKPKLSLKLGSATKKEEQEPSAPAKADEQNTALPEKEQPPKPSISKPKLKLQSAGQSRELAEPTPAIPATTEPTPEEEPSGNIPESNISASTPPEDSLPPPSKKIPPNPVKLKQPDPQTIDPSPQPTSPPVIPPPAVPAPKSAYTHPQDVPEAKTPTDEPKKSGKKVFLLLLLALALIAIAYSQREMILILWSDSTAAPPTSTSQTATPAGVQRDLPLATTNDESRATNDLPTGDARIQAIVDELPINMVRDSVAAPGLIVDRITYRPGDLIDPSTGLRFYDIDRVERKILFVDGQQRYYSRDY